MESDRLGVLRGNKLTRYKDLERVKELGSLRYNLMIDEMMRDTPRCSS